jgi:hypothetical protein
MYRIPGGINPRKSHRFGKTYSVTFRGMDWVENLSARMQWFSHISHPDLKFPWRSSTAQFLIFNFFFRVTAFPRCHHGHSGEIFDTRPSVHADFLFRWLGSYLLPPFISWSRTLYLNCWTSIFNRCWTMTVTSSSKKAGVNTNENDKMENSRRTNLEIYFRVE